MAEEYYFNGENLNAYKSQLNIVKQDLFDSYTLALSLYNSIKESEWSGQARDAMVAYMDLLIQFHGKFCGENGTVAEAVKAFDQLEDDMGEFYSSFGDYLAMSQI